MFLWNRTPALGVFHVRHCLLMPSRPRGYRVQESPFRCQTPHLMLDWPYSVPEGARVEEAVLKEAFEEIQRALVEAAEKHCGERPTRCLSDDVARGCHPRGSRIGYGRGQGI